MADQAGRMEIVSDRSSELGSRYARLVSVVNFETRPRRRTVLMPRAPLLLESPTQSYAPRGSMTFTGVVLRLETTGLVLRTRVDGEKWILVRRGTRFREDGLQVGDRPAMVGRIDIPSVVTIRTRHGPLQTHRHQPTISCR
jgi:hypothetical protein